jgi:hypothetical protein
MAILTYRTKRRVNDTVIQSDSVSNPFKTRNPILRQGRWRVRTDPERYRDLKEPAVHVVGKTFARAIERWEIEHRGDEGVASGRTVRPHMRRAHSHLYWTGEGRQQLRVCDSCCRSASARRQADRRTGISDRNQGEVTALSYEGSRARATLGCCTRRGRAQAHHRSIAGAELSRSAPPSRHHCQKSDRAHAQVDCALRHDHPP